MLKLKKLFGKYLKQPPIPYQQKYQKDISRELESAINKRNQLLEEFKAIREQQYLKITEEEVKEVEFLLEKHKRLLENQNRLRVKFFKTNATMRKIVENEYAIEGDIQEIKKTYRMLKLCESDLLYLENEETNTTKDRKLFLSIYAGLKFSIVAISIGAILSALPMTYLLANNKYNAAYNRVSIGVCMSVFIILGLIVWGKSVSEEAIDQNEKVLKNIYSYIRKVKIRYQSTSSCLEGELAKYEADSLATLEMYYGRYKKNKENFAQYSQISNNVFKVENEILGLLGPYGVKDFSQVRDWLKETKVGKIQFAMKNYEQSIKDLECKISQLEEEIS